MENSIQKIIQTLMALNLYEPGLVDKLYAYSQDPVNAPEIAVYKEFNGEKIRFEFDFAFERNKSLSLVGYDLMLPRKIDTIDHQVSNGIDSSALEDRMAAIDWNKHPGHFFEQESNELTLKMHSIMTDLDKFAGDRESEAYLWLSEITDALMVKYFSETPLASALMGNLPYYRATFYDLYPMTPDVTAEEAFEHVKNLNREPTHQAGFQR